MTEKPKKQLFNGSIMPAVNPARTGEQNRRINSPQYACLLLIPLLAIFVTATIFETSLFVFIAFTLLACIAYLIPLRNRIAKRQSAADLKVQDITERMNMVEVEIQQEDLAIKAFQEKIVNYAKLKGMTERLSMCLTLEDTSKTLSAETNKLFGGRETTIILYLFHSKTGELGISSSQKGLMRINLKAKQGDLFDRWIVKTMQPLLIDDAKNDYRFDVDKIKAEETRPIRSLLGVSLCVGNKALGIFRIDSPRVNHFRTEDLRFLMTIGDLGAVAIENAQLYEKVEQLAVKDGLTNLYLRRYLYERMPGEISRQLRTKKQLGFLMIDIDHFKQYNDRFGHVAGDIVLRTVGELLAELFSEPGHLVCRYGGEEFCVLLPDCSQKKAVELAEIIREKIEQQTVILRREKTHITISVGVAVFPQDAKSKEELINKADQALYRAKKKGRNCVVASSLTT